MILNALGRRLRHALVVLVLVCSFATPAAAFGSTPLSITDNAAIATIKPDLRSRVTDQLAASTGVDLTSYTIAVTLDDGTKPTLSGRLTVDYVNITAKALTDLPFRLYANSPDPGHDAITVGNVTVAGRPVAPALSVDNSLLTVPLPRSLADGASVTVTMNFRASIPVDTDEHYGIFGVDTKTGTWSLAHWYPVIAGWDAVDGWELDPTSVNGDPVFSDTAEYQVAITAPAAWEIVSTGTVIARSDDGAQRTQHIVTGAVRDVAIVANESFDSVSKTVDGTTITSWYLPGNAPAGKAALTYAAQALALYNTLFGPYPYLDFDVAPVELYGASGVEFPQLIYVAQSYYGGTPSTAEPNAMEFTVAHEVMHQWWYGMVGNNQYLHAFMDEGLTNFVSSRIYFTKEYGANVGDELFEQACAASFRTTTIDGGDQIVDTPTDAFPATGAYVWAAYSKAPVGFNAIYNEIGATAFEAGLADYLDEHAFGIAQPDDLLKAFEEASGEDLTALWNHWFEERDGQDDV